MKRSFYPRFRHAWSVACVLLILGAVTARLRFIESPIATAADEPTPTAKTFRLNDGTALPIEEPLQPTPYLRWQAPIENNALTVLYEYSFESDLHIQCVVLDERARALYWIAQGGNRHGRICRCNMDGTGFAILLKSFSTPDGPKELAESSALCLAPRLGKMYWISRSPFPANPGHSIFEANLDGSSVRPIINGLTSGFALAVDEDAKCIYWQYDKAIWVANLDGINERKLPIPANATKSFAINFSTNEAFFVHDDCLAKQSLDGVQWSSLVDVRFDYPNQNALRSILLDTRREYVYWRAGNGLVRTSLHAPFVTQQITELTMENPLDISSFALDDKEKRIAWTKDMDRKLVIADLPPPLQMVSSAGPPLIFGFLPAQVATGTELTIEGTRLDGTKQVFFVGVGTGECVEAQIEKITDSRLVVLTPKFVTSPSRASLIVVGEGGATVLLSRSTSSVKAVVHFDRDKNISNSPYYVQDHGHLTKVENRLVYVNRGGRADTGLRGGNTFLVKNGGRVLVRNLPTYVFCESQGQVVFPGKMVKRIPVLVIVPSFVSEEIRIGKE